MKTNPLSHDEIAGRARAIWQSRHCPSGCDDAIWLEAEAELVAARPPAGTGGAAGRPESRRLGAGG